MKQKQTKKNSQQLNQKLMHYSLKKNHRQNGVHCVLCTVHKKKCTKANISAFFFPLKSPKWGCLPWTNGIKQPYHEFQLSLEQMASSNPTMSFNSALNKWHQTTQPWVSTLPWTNGIKQPNHEFQLSLEQMTSSNPTMSFNPPLNKWHQATQPWVSTHLNCLSTDRMWPTLTENFATDQLNTAYMKPMAHDHAIIWVHSKRRKRVKFNIYQYITI